MEIRILYVAEIVGKAGIQCVKQLLPGIKEQYRIDFAVANIDGATNGTGCGKNHAGYIRKLGFDVLTGGDMIYYKKDLVDDFSTMSYVLRPANFPIDSPGRSWKICTLKSGVKIAVLSLLGYTGFSRVHAENPFLRLPHLLEKIKSETPCILIDYHATTTAEKRSFAYFADGSVSAVIGSHGRVQTADARVFPNGTAAITDAGRTGCVNAPGGCLASAAIGEYISGIPNWTKGEEISEASHPQLEGLVLVINEQGKALSIERLRVPLLEEATHA